MIIVNEAAGTAVDLLPIIFLVIGLIGCCLAILALIIGRKKNNSSRGTIIGLSVLAFFNMAGAIPTGIIGMNNVGNLDRYLDYLVKMNSGHYMGLQPVSLYHNACSWVCMGLSIFTLVFGTFAFIFQLLNLKAPVEQGTFANQIIVPGQRTVLFTASSNNGIGLWTSICQALSSIFGVESKNVSKKCDMALSRVRKQLTKLMEMHPEYEYRDFRIIKDGNIAYTGTVYGVLKNNKH